MRDTFAFKIVSAEFVKTQKHYTEALTLTAIAEKFGFSTSYITKLFRNFLGKGTVYYVNDLRLSAACEYLIFSNLTIGEISNRIGFQNQYYFDRLFKRKYSVTPKEFRKSNDSFVKPLCRLNIIRYNRIQLNGITAVNNKLRTGCISGKRRKIVYRICNIFSLCYSTDRRKP